jgi:hypothetical protein
MCKKFERSHDENSEQPDGHVAQQAHTRKSRGQGAAALKNVHEKKKLMLAGTTLLVVSAHMTAAAAPALAQADLAASLDSAKFLSTDAASSTMGSSRGLARSSDTRNGSKPGARVRLPLRSPRASQTNKLHLQSVADL